jgi:hypothetical protein
MSNSLSHAHEVERTLKEAVFYPAHDARTESPAYAKAHHHLVVELDLPCLVCGVRNSTLKDPTQNTANARDMETHHHVIEWALQNAIDLAKFNTRIWPALVHQHPGKYPTPFTQQEMLDFIDHSEDNLWVLCDVHHRHSLVGIHSITGPIWGAQDLVKSDFDYIEVPVAKAKK